MWSNVHTESRARTTLCRIRPRAWRRRAARAIVRPMKTPFVSTEWLARHLDDPSVIVVDAKYNFTPLFGDYVPGFGSLGELKEKSFHSPRNSCVDFVKGNNCLNPC